MLTRRDFLKYSLITGAAATLPLKFGVSTASAANSSPMLPKFAGALRGLRIQGLFDLTAATPAAVAAITANPALAGGLMWLRDGNGIPVLDFPMINPDPVFDAKSNPFGDVMSPGTVVANLSKKETLFGASMYNIACGEYMDYLHPAWEPTTTSAGFPTRLWGYYDANSAPLGLHTDGTPIRRHLGGVIVAVRGFGNRLRFTNKLTSDGTPTGLPLQHILPNDKLTIPGANEGDNRIAVHLHGGWMPWIHDGGPFDWFKPTANGNAGAGTTVGLSFMNGMGGIMDNITLANGAPVAMPMQVGQADYYYPNLASTRLLWYHDHAFGITRINAYAGVATGYLQLDPVQEAVLNTTLESVGAYTTLLDNVFCRLVGLPLGTNLELDLDPVINPGYSIRTAIVDTVAGVKTAYGIPAAGTIPSILSTIPIVVQEKKFVDADPITANHPANTFTTDLTWANPIVAPARVQSTGSMWYEHVYDPKVFKLASSKKQLPDPSAQPEFHGDTILINGTISPMAQLEPKAYRFMFLNATQARAFNINLMQVAPGGEVATPVNAKTGLPMPPTNYVNTANPIPVPTTWIIGTEAGYLKKAVPKNNQNWADPINFTGNVLFLGGERVDVVIDFTGCAGNEYVFYNDAASPFPLGPPINDYFTGNLLNPAMIGVPAGTTRDTRNMMKLQIVAAPTISGVTFPEPSPNANMLNVVPRVWDAFEETYATYTLNALTGRYNPLVAPTVNSYTGAAITPKSFTLNEDFDLWGRLRQLVGGTTLGLFSKGFGILYLDPLQPAEIINIQSTASAVGTPGTTTPEIEVWNIYNTTADTHPMHIHMANAQILNRQPFKVDKTLGLFRLVGFGRGPEPEECGWKETFKMHPGERIQLLLKWELPPVPFGQPVPASARITGYETVWHCHILEHEEHDMMRPLQINSTNPWW